MSETQYALHSVVRKSAFRSFRAQLPAHMRKNHRVCDQTLRLVPERRLLITETVLRKHLEELRQKCAMHILEVRTMDGRLVDLKTLTPGPAAPAVVQPHPRLDSVAYDTPTGQYIPPYVGDDMSMPSVLPPGQKPSLLTQEEATRRLDEEAKKAAVEAAPVQDAPTVPDVDAELEAAIAEAQSEASEGEADKADTTQSQKKGKRGRR